MGMWSANLSIGVPEIDAQHKKLIEAIESLSDACFKGQGKDKIEQTLTFVINYTHEHFSDEEKLLAKIGYPQLSAHKLLHIGFINELSQIQAEVRREGAVASLSIKLNKVLMSWLIGHINVEDKKYALYIKTQARN